MAWRPMGTMRVLLPLPSTRTVRSFRSMAESSSPTSSLKRRPDE